MTIHAGAGRRNDLLRNDSAGTQSLGHDCRSSGLLDLADSRTGRILQETIARLGRFGISARVLAFQGYVAHGGAAGDAGFQQDTMAKFGP